MENEWSINISRVEDKIVQEKELAMLEGKEIGLLQGLEEGMQKGVELGIKQAKLEVAKKLIGLLDEKIISEKTGINLNIIKEIVGAN